MSAERASLAPNKLFYRIDEAAACMAISRSRIYELIREGELELGKLAGRSVIPRSSVEDYCARSYKPVTPQKGAVPPRGSPTRLAS